MGRKRYAANMLQWTICEGHNVLGVVTDTNIQNQTLVNKANEFGVPIYTIEEANEIVKTNHGDLVVSYLYGKKIGGSLISKPYIGCINFHPAILPDWKGVAGYNIAILNKLSEWGATAHIVDENIDTGPIIKIFKFNFDYKIETAYSLAEKTQKIQCDLYKSVIKEISENNKIVKTYPNVGGKYISRKNMDEMKKIKEGCDIDLLIRAFWYPPYEGASIEINGKRYTLINEYILKELADND